MIGCQTFARLGAGVLLWMVAAAGIAAEPARPLSELARCRAIANDPERLACLDHATDALLASERGHEVVILTPGDVERTRQSMFGFSIPDLKAFGAVADKAAPPVLHFTGKVVRARLVSYGKYDIAVDSGAVWRNLDLLSEEPRAGTEVKIDRTPVGGYLMKLPYESSAHATRVH